LLTSCAAAGGTILIIGSAARVAQIGILKFDFMWYVKNISRFALLGYISGIITLILLH
jgi:hypothetical protein